jgi:hypothetical protein
MMTTSILEQLRALHALLESDPTLPDVANAQFKLLQSLVTQVIQQLEHEQTDPLHAKQQEQKG